MKMSFAKVVIPTKSTETRLCRAVDSYKKDMEKLENVPYETLNFLQKRDLVNFRTAKAMENKDFFTNI